MSGPMDVSSCSRPSTSESSVISGLENIEDVTSKEKVDEKVTVVIRLRPLSQNEVNSNEEEVYVAEDRETLLLNSSSPNTSLSFNAVFDPSTTSREVYTTTAQRLVASAMEGYNCTIFAYGQTGSGKTYTMGAVMSYAAEDIFDHINTTKGRDFLLKLSAVEIYNEFVYDLLRNGSPELRVLEDQEKGVMTVGATEEYIGSVSDFHELVRVAESRRHVRSTAMNMASSRSHLIVRLYVESRPSTAAAAGKGEASTSRQKHTCGVPVRSIVNFVDLAGSERQAQAALPENDKGRQQEAGQINKTLLHLGCVIRALGDGQPGKHIPYRNSKLTRILQSSLSGNSRMAIICTISPASGSVDNTKSAVQFATFAKNVVMRPRVNRVDDKKALIKQLHERISILQQQLKQVGNIDDWEVAQRLKEEQDKHRMTAEERDELRQRLEYLERVILRGGLLRDKSCLSLSQDHALGFADKLRPSFSVLRGSTPNFPPGVNEHSSGNPARRPPVNAQVNTEQDLDMWVMPPFVSKPTAPSPVLAPQPINDAARQLHSSAQQAQLPSDQRQAVKLLQVPSLVEAQQVVAALRAELNPAASSDATNLVMEYMILQRTESPSQDLVQAMKAQMAIQGKFRAADVRAHNIFEALQHKIDSLNFGDEDIMMITALQEQLSSHQQDKADHRYSTARSATSVETGDDVTSEGEAAANTPEHGCNAFTDTGKAADQFLRDSMAPLMGSPTASMDRSQPRNSTSDQDKMKQLLRSFADRYNGRKLMYAEFMSSAEKDVNSLKEVVGEYKERIEMLETQKKLLFNQVLQWEQVVDGYKQKEQAHKSHVAQLEQQCKDASSEAQQAREIRDVAVREGRAAREEARAAREELAALRAAAAAAGAGGSHGQPSPTNGHSQPLVPSLLLNRLDDEWARPETVDNLLPRIVRLWDQLHIPLAYRSRFVVNFEGHEVFYYELEYRRLQWKQNESATHARDLARSARMLVYEKRTLAHCLKRELSDQEREQLYLEWGINQHTQERKLQLINKLWSEEVLTQEDGMMKCARLVLRLTGKDATDQVLDLVFGDYDRERHATTRIVPSRTMLANMLNKVAIRPPSPGRAAGAQTSQSTASFVSRLLTPRGQSTPRSQNLVTTPRQKSDLSILSGLTSVFRGG